MNIGGLEDLQRTQCHLTPRLIFVAHSHCMQRAKNPPLLQPMRGAHILTHRILKIEGNIWYEVGLPNLSTSNLSLSKIILWWYYTATNSPPSPPPPPGRAIFANRISKPQQPFIPVQTRQLPASSGSQMHDRAGHVAVCWASRSVTSCRGVCLLQPVGFVQLGGRPHEATNMAKS